MTTQAPQDVLDDPVKQLLIHYGQLQERIERYEQAERDRQAAAGSAETERLSVLSKVNKDVCTLKWIMQPQGRVLIANRVYTGRGPQRDRVTGRVIKQGSTFTAPADHARVLEESGYAEIIEGRERIIPWNDPRPFGPGEARETAPVIQTSRMGPASAETPAPGDDDAWKAREVFYG